MQWLMFSFFLVIFYIGKFAQRPNMTQVRLIKDPVEYFDLLSNDEVTVTDANFINDEIIVNNYFNFACV